MYPETATVTARSHYKESVIGKQNHGSSLKQEVENSHW